MTALYETDFTEWLDYQIKHLRSKEFEKLDMVHLLEEMEDLGKSQKSSIESHLEIILIHMLKQVYQPDYQSKSWQDSINNARMHIRKIIKYNPSLRSYSRLVFMECFEDARREASKQTGIDLWVFEKECDWTIEEVLGE